VRSFVTVDGSTIRELASAARAEGPHQSLAEATVRAGRETIEHLHRTSEEIYYFTSGRGRMRLGEEESDVADGDCVVIPPGTRHKLWAGPDGDLVLLCACAPPYSDDDTELTEAGGQ
jgi:mannose-6-phosphate isomerase-like protein (cupin superfamily)